MKRALAWAKLLGIALFIYILSRLDYGRLAQTLATIRPGWLALYFPLALAVPVLKSLRWHLVQRHFAGKADLKSSFSLNFETFFLAFTTPGRVGDMLKILLLEQRTGIARRTCLTIYLYDRVQDIFCLAIISLLGVVFIFERELGPDITAVIFGVVALYLGKNSILRFVARRYDRKSVITSTLSLELHMIAINSLIYGGMVLAVYILAIALNIKVGYLQLAVIQGIGAMASLVPISVSGLGVREGIFILLLGDFGANPEQAMTLSLLDNVAFAALVIIVLYLVHILFLRPPATPAGRSRENPM